MVVIVAVSCKEAVSVCGIVATGQVAELGAADTTFSQESTQTGVDATTFSQESSQTGVEATTFSQESLQTGSGFNCINADHSITYSNLGCILRVQPSFFWAGWVRVASQKMHLASAEEKGNIKFTD